MKKPSMIAGALALSLSAVLSTPPATAALPISVFGQQITSLAPMLEKVTPAVVSVTVEGSQNVQPRLSPFDGFGFPFAPRSPMQERPFRGLGSGVIINAEKAYVVTNHHVIEGAKTIEVTLQDGRSFHAKLIGSDALSDIALLQLEKASHLTEIKMADSDTLRVGDFAVAIGNPFDLGQTVTSGIVSALGRSGLNRDNYENFIQTDAAINRGNSGGALVNLNGELIGIPSAIYGPNGGNVGIGFAIPSNMVKNLVSQLAEFGETKRGVIGIKGMELSTELAQSFGLETNLGAFVSEVLPDSAAQKAGLQAGDIITAVNGKEIRSFAELRAKVATLGPGKTVTLTYNREGKQQQTQLTLQEGQYDQASAAELHPALEGAELVDSDGQGIVIESVNPDSAAARYGLKAGDIIKGVNRQTTNSLSELKAVLQTKPSVIALQLVRNQRSLYLVIG